MTVSVYNVHDSKVILRDKPEPVVVSRFKDSRFKLLLNISRLGTYRPKVPI